MTFADVLGLWPFTLDEFVQALHDYVSFTRTSTFFSFCSFCETVL